MKINELSGAFINTSEFHKDNVKQEKEFAENYRRRNETIYILLGDMCHSWEFKGFQPLNSEVKKGFNGIILFFLMSFLKYVFHILIFILYLHNTMEKNKKKIQGQYMAAYVESKTVALSRYTHLTNYCLNEPIGTVIDSYFVLTIVAFICSMF